ncbi:MAG: hypothetical protein DHS20C15_03670 [Planctomycetota bacterium]|nr:MAG: hypothetical protein DHS20C15_03670 [Planctomycetota bacterium]
MTRPAPQDSAAAARAFGERYDYDISYMLDLLERSAPAYARYEAFLPMASPLDTAERTLPLEAFFVAKLSVLLEEDCGPCAQLCLAMAREAQVDGELLSAVLERGVGLPAALAEVRRFALAMNAGSDFSPELGARVEEHYGAAARAELCVLVAAARVFPALKRGLGFGQSCAHTPLRV